MMNRTGKYIIFIFFLIVAIDQRFVALVRAAIAEGVIVRPVMEYKSDKLRDPFKTYLIKEEVKVDTQENLDLINPEFDLSKLKVQGTVWGVKIPQAIINGKVLTIGDLVEDAEILSIDNKGITLSFKGAIYNLAAPGQSTPQAKASELK